MHFSKSSRHLQTSFVGLGILWHRLIQFDLPLSTTKESKVSLADLFALCSPVLSRAVNDQVFLTAYLFTITTSVNALWQLSCTSPLQVLLRDNLENFLAKSKNTDSSQILAFSLPPQSWYLLVFFPTSNRRKIVQELCPYCKIVSLFPHILMKERGYSLLEAAGTSKHKLTVTWQQDTKVHWWENYLKEKQTAIKKHPRDIKEQPPTSKLAFYNQTSPTWLLTAQTH